MILNNLRRFLILRSQRFRDGIWQAVELRTFHSQLTRNEHDPVVFIENQKSQPRSGLAFHLRSHQVDWPWFALKKISRSLFSVV